MKNRCRLHVSENSRLLNIKSVTMAHSISASVLKFTLVWNLLEATVRKYVHHKIGN